MATKFTKEVIETVKRSDEEKAQREELRQKQIQAYEVKKAEEQVEEEEKLRRREIENWERVVLKRKINYTIMRELWKMYREKMEEFYDDFCGITPNKYSQILSEPMLEEGEKGKYTDYRLVGVAKRLEEKVGISKEYFLGHRMLKLDRMTEDEWRKYFEAKYDKYAEVDGEDALKTIKEIRKKYREALGRIEDYITKPHKEVDSNEEDVYRLYHYIRWDRPFQGLSLSWKLDKSIEFQKKLDIKELQMLDSIQLEKYHEVLKKNKDLVGAILLIKKYEEASKKERKNEEV